MDCSSFNIIQLTVSDFVMLYSLYFKICFLKYTRLKCYLQNKRRPNTYILVVCLWSLDIDTIYWAISW